MDAVAGLDPEQADVRFGGRLSPELRLSLSVTHYQYYPAKSAPVRSPGPLLLAKQNLKEGSLAAGWLDQFVDGSQQAKQQGNEILHADLARILFPVETFKYLIVLNNY